MLQRSHAAALLTALVAAGCKPSPAPRDAPVEHAPDGAPTTPAASAPTPEDAAVPAAVDAPPIEPRGAAAFEMAFFKRRAERGGNVMVSATSLRSALGITYLGAKGATADELRFVLGLAATPDAAAAEALAESKAWATARGAAELAVANRLWASDKGLVLDEGFTARAKRGYEGGVQTVPFVGDGEAARTTINEWVSRQTKAKIPELLPQGSLSPLTRLVVTNAIYFKGSWAKKFQKAETREQFFKVDGTTSASVPTMHQKSAFKVSLEGAVKAVELPYAGTSMAMLILMPEGALATFESALTPEVLATERARLQPREVSLFLPKYTFRSGGSVKADLEALGIHAAFSDKADFTGIARTPKDLYVTDVFHQTFVAVDEEGTEAAAATGAVMATRGVAAPSPELRIDRPFLFVLHDTKTGKVLFVGRVTDPTRH